jgi:hypothetical protein
MDEQIRIATHLLACPLCTAEAAETRRFLAEVPALPVPSPVVYTLPHTVRRIFATQISSPAPNMVRRGPTQALPPTQWPRHYQAESINVSLHLSRDSKKEFVLLAIMTDSDPAVSLDAYEGADAELYPIERSSQEQNADGKRPMPTQAPLLRTHIDDLGNIVFRAVPLGNYTLVVHLPGHDLVIEDIAIASG